MTNTERLMLAGWLAINESCQKWLASRAGVYRSVVSNDD